MKRLAALAAMVLLAGCEPGSALCIDTPANCRAYRAAQDAEIQQASDGIQVRRGLLDVYHDSWNGVTCWSKSNSTLYCMPDWMIQRPEVTP